MWSFLQAVTNVQVISNGFSTFAIMRYCPNYARRVLWKVTKDIILFTFVLRHCGTQISDQQKEFWTLWGEALQERGMWSFLQAVPNVQVISNGFSTFAIMRYCPNSTRRVLWKGTKDIILFTFVLFHCGTQISDQQKEFWTRVIAFKCSGLCDLDLVTSLSRIRTRALITRLCLTHLMFLE